MGVLYFGSDIAVPSVLWMRRMLAGLDEHVAALATEFEAPAEFQQRYRTVWVQDSSWVWLSKLLRRAGLMGHVPATTRAVRTLTAAVQDDAVDVSLIHYLTTGVRYERVWEAIEKPVWIHCHGNDVTWDRRLDGQPDRRLHPENYVDRVIALPPHVQFIANSNITISRLVDIGIARDRVHLKYLGVPVEPELPDRDYSSREPTILYLGRLVDFKGPLEVIRAFGMACERGLAGKLVVAGDGPLMKACQATRVASSVSNRIELLGAVDAEAGARLRAQADIFTAHNQFGPDSRQEEAFGVSVAEALAEGLPVVTGDNGSIAELMVDGEHGRLVEPGDVEAHADAFVALAENPEMRAEMGRRGWQRVRDHFSSEREDHRLREILGI